MDGVLIKSMKYHILSWKKAFNDYNIYPTNKDLSQKEGMSFKETINILSKKYNVKLTKEEKKNLI